MALFLHQNPHLLGGDIILKKGSVRTKLILGILLACILPFIIGGLYIGRIITDQVNNDFKNYSHEVTGNINARIYEGCINPAYKAISLLALDDRTLELANILGDRQISRPEMIDAVFQHHLANYANINYPNISSRMLGIVLGTEQGGYIEYPSFFTEPGYDPRARSWYQEALKHQGKACLIDPYIMQTTGEMAVTVVRTVEHNGKTVGVVGVGWNMQELQKEVEELKIGLSGYIIILNQNNKIIICPTHSEWLMKTPQEINLPELMNLADDGGMQQVTIDGKNQLIHVNKSEASGWKIIAVIDASELQGRVREILRPIFIVYFVTLTLILSSIFIVAKRYVIQPISALTEKAAAIAGGDLGAMVVINRSDEFGILAATFNEMASKLKENFNKIREQNEILSKREKEFQTLVENAQDIILRVSESLTIIYINPTFESYTSVPVSELFGQKLDVLKMPECFLNVVEDAFSKDGVMCNNSLIEFEITTTGGETLNMQAHIIPEFYANKNIETVLAIIRNITQRKHMEKQLARLDRLNLIGEMAAGIAHEVRNPMTTVRGFLQMIFKKEVDSPYRSFYSLMIEELDRANGIITEFLSLAKTKTVNRSYSNLNDIIKAIEPLIQVDATVNNKIITLELVEIPLLLLDDKEIRQLIINMVRNGLEAMQEKGAVKIRTYYEENTVVLAIKDQGNGIKAEILENIGIPFQTTKETGTGLGLAVCYSIAARHNAKISVETGTNGTEFFIRFDCDQ